MPTLYSALRTHLREPQPAAAKHLRAPQLFAKVVPPRVKHKKEEIYRVSLTDRFNVRQVSPRPTVIVVGAGLAGLAAAYELHSVGYDVTVVEGRERVGGRVETLHNLIAGRVVEGGAELIGSNHHAWLSYKHKFHLHFSDVLEPPNAPIILGGWRLSNEEARVLHYEFERATDELNAAASRVNADMPWKSPHARALDKTSLREAVEEIKGASALCKLAILEQLVTDNGVPAEGQSYLGVLAMIKGGGGKSYWADTEVFRCREGNQKLAEKLADSLPTGSVHLNCQVKRIRIRDRGVEVWTSKGKTLTARDLILAVPPSIWRSVRFDPDLPKRYLGQFGRNVKYLMNVEKNSWSPLSPSLSSDGPIDLTWQATDQQRGPRAALVAFSGASDADECRRWKRRKKRYLARLAPIYPRIKYVITKSKFMDWPGNKWTRGSYSFPAPGEVMRVGPLMRKPFHKWMHFAGEHTCYAFVGYMEGALQSGLRVAEQLARRDGVI